MLEKTALRPLARVAPYEGLLVTSDIPGGPQAPDFVTGPSPSARRVDRLTIRRSVKRALDLGTGPGIQALRAASHAEEVVAVDVSERAVAFARFNAALNGFSNIDLRQGDWFEPVDGERFDLIVANPPYVVSPESELLYRDGDLPGDAVTMKVLREAPRHLEEGGFAQVMGNWVHGSKEDWRAPLEASVAGTGCDALLLRYPSIDLVSYAAAWNLLLATGGAKGYLQAVDRWLDFYTREGIEAISDGMVVLRRRSGGVNWVRAIEVPGSPAAGAGDHVLRLFEARDRRDELADDEAMLAARFERAPGLKLSWRAEGPGLAERKAKVGLENVTPAIAELVEALDGSRRLDGLADGKEVVSTLRRLFALGLVSASAE
jgi:methylase of polypeptide subunit release factors